MAAELAAVFLYAVINPAAILAGLWFGWQASEPQKIPIAALIAAIAGSALVWVVGAARLGFTLGHERAPGGLFVALILVGLVAAVAGYAARRVAGRGNDRA